MISSLAWIPKGAADPTPGTAEYTAEELAVAREAAGGGDEDELVEEASNQGSMDTDDEPSEDEGAGDSVAADIAKAKAFAAALGGGTKSGGRTAATDDIDAAMAELDMENYDAEEDGGGEAGVTGVFGNSNPGLAYYANNAADPYIKLAAAADALDDSEKDDFEIRGDDFLLLAAKNEDDVSHLEVWVYEEDDENGAPNLYVHHDVLLPAFPLSLAWLDCAPGGPAEPGNFVAVGTMSPGIEIWDLDVLETVEPAAVLGGEAVASDVVESEDGVDAATKKRLKKKLKKKKKKKKPDLKEGSHSSAVLGLSWNREYRNVLASGSADTSVKVWDVAAEACQATLDWHSDKVQAVAWNPADAPVLLSGGFDRKVFLGDARSPSSNLAWDVSADVEALAWDPHTPTRFLASAEDGIVAAFDARRGGGAAPLFRLQAHDAPTCCVCFNPVARDLLATTSTDKKVKLWDLATSPALVISKEMKAAGAVFAAAFCPEQPALFAYGGSNGELAIWDVLASAPVAEKYGKALAKAARAALL